MSISNYTDLVSAYVYQYNTLSDGKKRIYRDEDELSTYGSQGILDPNDVSYYSLFINGVLQAKTNYEIQRGLLTLKTEDIPLEGSTIILSFITFVDKKTLKLNSARVRGQIPEGHIASGPVVDKGINIAPSFVQHFKLEISILSGPTEIFTGQIGQWTCRIRIENIGQSELNEIYLHNRILLHEIMNIEIKSIEAGIIDSYGPLILWKIDSMMPGESLTATFEIEACIRNQGRNYLANAFATARVLGENTMSDLVCSSPINVDGGLYVKNVIVSGPTSVNLLKYNKWKIEVNVWNLSSQDISDVLLTNTLFPKSIARAEVVSISKGLTCFEKKKLLWKIDVLNPWEVCSLTIELEASFNKAGARSLSLATAMGKLRDRKVFSNKSVDFQVDVLPSHRPVTDILAIEKNIDGKNLLAFAQIPKTWKFSLKVTNHTDRLLKDIIITDYILLDKVTYIRCLWTSLGSTSIFSDTIMWRIDQLRAGESAMATFTSCGTFLRTGLGYLNRAIGKALVPDASLCIISGLVSSPPIRIGRTSDIKRCTLVVHKVFSQYKDRVCFKNLIVHMDRCDLSKITFGNGFIVRSSLDVEDIESRPDHKRVRLTIRIPYKITSEDKGTVRAYLPNIDKDIVVYIPDNSDEQEFDILLESNSRLLNIDSRANGQSALTVGVFIIIKAVGKVELSVPYLNLQEKLASCNNMPSHAHESLEKMTYSNFYPDRIGTGPYIPQLPIGKISCPPIFGDFCIQKTILSGPLTVVPGRDYSWTIEFRVSNVGHGPISNVVMVDTLKVEGLIHIDLVHISQGQASVQGGQIIWKVGNLGSTDMALMIAEVCAHIGANDGNILRAENHQFSTSSHGGKKKFTDEDQIAIYGNGRIPNRDHVSYFSLFINGVLQPETNYLVKENLLEITTIDTPLDGVPITLESVRVLDGDNRLLKARTYQYNAYAHGEKIYGDLDEIGMYGNEGILDPAEVSFYLLFVNGLLQPRVNYEIGRGILVLKSSDIPLEASPLSIQFVSL
ncbi:MAG: DUF4183 domain-containing protein [Tissierellaceae bacterium]